MNENQTNSEQRASVLTFAVAKSLAIATIEQLNKSSIGQSIASDRAHQHSIGQMVNAQLQEAIMNKA